MNVARLLVQTVTVIRVTQDGAPDETGDPTEQTTTTTHRRAGYAWQTSRSDRTANESVQVEEWRAALRRDLVVTGADRLVIEGIEFELDGPPWPARHARTGRVEFLEVTMRRTST